MTPGAMLDGSRCTFRVWAPEAGAVHLKLEGGQGQCVPMASSTGGYFTATVEGVHAGQLYRYQVAEHAWPDPCSRFQPEGPHGPSQVVDRRAYHWHDQHWGGIALEGAVLYELHVGTFTAEGTFAAATQRLGHLKALGVNAVEIMPVAECPGRFNWGYDGVGWFAPSHNYGPYDAFKAFVDAAHAQGIGVVLDVVYNHFGPDGNYASAFSPYYQGSRNTEWGGALNYDGRHCAAVREMVVANAWEWISQFHLDGLRLDAIQSIFDDSRPHIIAELAAAARAAAGGRRILVIAEDETQRGTWLLPAGQGGAGLDGMWNDDFHHAAMVAATGRREAYYHDYLGTPQEFVSAAKRGFLYQGQYYPWQDKARGTPVHTRSMHFVACLQNHDQVANSLEGKRLHQQASPGLCRALTAMLLLGPQTPMLFMGQEFHASAPFLFFADHEQPLRQQVHAGRSEFLSQFPGMGAKDARGLVADPADEATFRRCKLDWSECSDDSPALRLHQDLLALRREDPVIRGQGRGGFDGAVLGEQALLLRWFGGGDDRLLIINLGADLRERPMPEPLLAPPAGRRWSLVWSSEVTRYGGSGTVDPGLDSGGLVPGHSAMLLRAVEGDSHVQA